MKKGINVIQIKGTKGIILAVGIICCLFAGFIAFPGFVMMHIWNYISKFVLSMPSIGIIQGTLLWGIMVASYYTFRKEKHVMYLRAPLEGLSEEELKQVFADIKSQTQNDPVLQNLLKAREIELKINDLSKSGITNPQELMIKNEQEKNIPEQKETQNTVNTEQK